MFLWVYPLSAKTETKDTYKTPADDMSSGGIFILGKGVCSILAYGVKSTWPQGSSEAGFSSTDSHHKQRAAFMMWVMALRSV